MWAEWFHNANIPTTISKITHSPLLAAVYMFHTNKPKIPPSRHGLNFQHLQRRTVFLPIMIFFVHVVLSVLILYQNGLPVALKVQFLLVPTILSQAHHKLRSACRGPIPIVTNGLHHFVVQIHFHKEGGFENLSLRSFLQCANVTHFFPRKPIL